MVEYDGDVLDVSIIYFWISAYLHVELLGPSSWVKFLKIEKRSGLENSIGRPVLTLFPIVRPWTQKKTDYYWRSVRSYLVMGTIMLDHKIGDMLNNDLIEENL